MDKTKLTGAQSAVKAIEECGIDHFFYVEGGIFPLFPEISASKVKSVLCRNEKGACLMADGYARVSRKPTMCYAQHGAAAAILASVMYEPNFAHSPVVAFTGSVPTLAKDQYSYQECYEEPYFESTCKFNIDVTDVSRIPDYIRIGTQIAVSGCPGPVHIGIHNDMGDKPAEMARIQGDETFYSVPPFRPTAEPTRVMQAANLLIDARNPVMICGSGVHLSGAYDEVRSIAELMSIPVATNYNGKGAFPEMHPLSIGVTGTYGREVTNGIVRDADLVFFVGTRAGRHMTEEFTAPEIGKPKIIHLDIDPMPIGRIYKPDVPLLGDARETLRSMLIYLREKISKQIDRREALEKIHARIREYERIVDPLMASDSVPIKPQRLLKEISHALKEEDIVVCDTAHCISWTSRLLKMSKSGIHYVPCCGTLGSGLPLGLGASFAAKSEQRILTFVGDGGITYSISELETAARLKDKIAPFVVVVNNNSAFASSRGRLLREGGVSKPPENVPWTDFSNVDYAKVAQGFGCYGTTVERPGEISEAIKAGYESGKPALIDVKTDKLEVAPSGRPRINDVTSY